MIKGLEWAWILFKKSCNGGVALGWPWGGLGVVRVSASASCFLLLPCHLCGSFLRSSTSFEKCEMLVDRGPST